MLFFRFRDLLLFLAITCLKPALSQYAYFSQYNGNMGGLNPAMIASVDKNQVSLLGREQWRKHPMGAGLGARYSDIELPVYFANFVSVDPSFAPTFYPWRKRSITTDYGLLLHNPNGKYMGL